MNKVCSKIIWRLFHNTMVLLAGMIVFQTGLNGCIEKSQPGLIIESHEELGNNIYASTPVWIDNELHFCTTKNIVHGAGQGEDFTYWRRGKDTEEWKKQKLFPDHMPAMVTALPVDKETTLFLYVDRQDESNRVVYLQSLNSGEIQTLFEFSGGRGVLNPTIDMLPNDKLLVLIPDRTSQEVRRFIINYINGEVERLSDITMPRSGARIYERHVDGNKLIVPVSVVNEMILLSINMTDHTYEMYSVDNFTSVSNEPPRMTSIFQLKDSNKYTLVYLRPAEFSDRSGRQGPPTGLVGEIVINEVSAIDFKSISKTVIAGFYAEEASTHNIAATQIGQRDILVAHTTVDKIHQRHLTGEYENYVAGWLTHWRIDHEGNVEKISELELEPFWFTRIVSDKKGNVKLFYNEAKPGDPLHLKTLKVNNLRSLHQYE